MTNQPTAPRIDSEPPRVPPNGIVQVVDLVAAEHSWQVGSGVIAHGYGFNAQVPGPTIEATVGDTLRVLFKNSLSQPTSIHWHGLRVPAEAAQTRCEGASVPSGESFEYRLELPDAGTFWYHPPAHETARPRSGLYGALIVRDPAEPLLDGERVLIFGDLDHLGGTKDVDASARDGARRRGAGRLLVNGVDQPDMEIVAGQAERWRLVNAARGQLLRLSLSGAPLTLVGAGCGPVGEPVRVDQVLMAPGQRLDLVVGPLEAGQTIALQHRPRGPRRGAPREASLATLHVLPGPRRDANTGLDLRRFARDVAALANFDSPPTRTIQLGSNVALRCPATSVPGSSHFFDDPVQVGQLQVWDLCNPTDENHVFHLYGFFFQVLQINGTGPPFRSWNDTVSVPARGRVRIAWRADRRPGGWTYHFQSLERPGAITTASFQVT